MKAPRVTSTAETRPVRQRRARAATTAADPATPVPEMPAIPPTPEQILQRAREEAGAPQGPPPPFVPPHEHEPAPPPAPVTTQCQALVPLFGTLEVTRCQNDSAFRLIVGIVPALLVPLCREHCWEAALALRDRGIHISGGGV